MFCTFLADRIFDGIFHCLKLFLGQLAKALDVFDFLNLSQSSLALAAALVVFGVAKAAFLVAAGDDNSCAFQFNRCVLIFQIAGVKKDRTVLFAHGDGELIHDTAVASVEVVLRILSDQCQIGKPFWQNAHIIPFGYAVQLPSFPIRNSSREDSTTPSFSKFIE